VRISDVSLPYFILLTRLPGSPYQTYEPTEIPLRRVLIPDSSEEIAFRKLYHVQLLKLQYNEKSSVFLLVTS
jgi:hypothetical protein